MKYSKGFERDYDFYIHNLQNFNFCGTLEPKHKAISASTGLSAKEVFYLIQSEGVNKPCSEPELLNSLLLCQAGINFQIKQWAEGRSDGTLPLVELSKSLAQQYYPQTNFSEFKTLAWVKDEPVYYEDIQSQYGLPDWVIKAVQSQHHKQLTK